MNLRMVNNLIAESKLFRATGGFRRLNGRDMADLVFANTLGLIMLYLDGDDSGEAYARRMAQYPSYAIFRSSAPDLYLQCYTLAFPLNNSIKLENHNASVKFLQSLDFGAAAHRAIVRKIARGTLRDGEMRQYIFRLESQLKIASTKLKGARRDVARWDTLDAGSRRQAYTQLVREIRRITQSTQSDIHPSLLDRTSRRPLDAPVGRRTGEPGALKRAAGAAAGAAAGYALAPDKYKGIGSAIGGAAGYKLASRRKQR